MKLYRSSLTGAMSSGKDATASTRHAASLRFECGSEANGLL